MLDSWPFVAMFFSDSCWQSGLSKGSVLVGSKQGQVSKARQSRIDLSCTSGRLILTE